MNRIQVLFSFTLVFIGAFIFSSCAPNLSITIMDGEAADIDFSSNISVLGSSLTRRFTGTEGAGGALYDSKAISSSLSGMKIMIKRLSFPGGDGLEFSGSTKNLKNSAPGVFTHAKSSKSQVITLSPESVNEIMNRLPVETRDLLELLMAPVFTGENLHTDEYLDILAAAYGERAAAEIASSACTITLKVPGKISGFVVSGSRHERVELNKSGNTASASVPLDLLLTLREALILTLTWD